MKKWLCFLLPLCLAACGAESKFSPNDEQGLQLADKVSLFESKDSQKKWVLDAEQVDFADLNNAVLKKPVLFLKENGQDIATVTGDIGTFDYAKKKVGIEGNAQVKSLTQQVTLNTHRFYYDVDKDRVWSDDKTIIIRGSAKSTAREGIETDSKLQRIELKKQSTALPQNAQELQVKKKS